LDYFFFDDFFAGDFFEDFFEEAFFDGDFFDEDFFGTFAPSLRASDRPMAMACLRLVTFLPLRPLFRVPLFFSRMARSTFLPAFGLYFLPPEDLCDEDFFVAIKILPSPNWEAIADEEVARRKTAYSVQRAACRN
jgi:hypothetical protein